MGLWSDIESKISAAVDATIYPIIEMSSGISEAASNARDSLSTIVDKHVFGGTAGNAIVAQAHAVDREISQAVAAQNDAGLIAIVSRQADNTLEYARKQKNVSPDLLQNLRQLRDLQHKPDALQKPLTLDERKILADSARKLSYSSAHNALENIKGSIANTEHYMEVGANAIVVSGAVAAATTILLPATAAGATMALVATGTYVAVDTVTKVMDKKTLTAPIGGEKYRPKSALSEALTGGEVTRTDVAVQAIETGFSAVIPSAGKMVSNGVKNVFVRHTVAESAIPAAVKGAEELAAKNVMPGLASHLAYIGKKMLWKIAGPISSPLKIAGKVFENGASQAVPTIAGGVADLIVRQSLKEVKKGVTKAIASDVAASEEQKEPSSLSGLQKEILNQLGNIPGITASIQYASPVSIVQPLSPQPISTPAPNFTPKGRDK